MSDSRPSDSQITMQAAGDSIISGSAMHSNSDFATDDDAWSVNLTDLNTTFSSDECMDFEKKRRGVRRVSSQSDTPLTLHNDSPSQCITRLVEKPPCVQWRTPKVRAFRQKAVKVCNHLKYVVNRKILLAELQQCDTAQLMEDVFTIR